MCIDKTGHNKAPSGINHFGAVANKRAHHIAFAYGQQATVFHSQGLSLRIGAVGRPDYRIAYHQVGLRVLIGTGKQPGCQSYYKVKR